MKNLLISLLTITSFASFTQPQKLDRDSLLIDIGFLEEIVEEIHPGAYRYNSKSDIDKLFLDLRTDVYGDLDEAEWTIKLAQAMKKLRCGHTYVNPWNMKKSIRSRLFGGSIYFPLGFTIIDNEFIVTENLSGDLGIKKGGKIVSINDYSVKQVLDSLRTIAKLDGSNTSPVNEYLSLNEFTVDRWEAFDLFFYLFFRLEGDLNVTIESYEGKITEHKLNTLSKEERASRYKGRNTEEWLLSFENDKAIVKLGTFATWKWKGFDYKAWLENAFQKIDSAKTKNLVVDLRGNSGGLGEIGNELISYFTPLPIACDRRVFSRTLKADPKFKPYSDTWANWIFAGLNENQYKILDAEFYELEESFQCDPIQPKTKTFDGTVYFLGGSSNVSATFTLMKRGKELNNAYFIGTQTGGNAQGINGGEYIFFYLPYSGMEVDIPLKFFSGGPEAKDQGIRPDFIARYTQEDIKNGTDPHLTLVDELVENENKLTSEYILELMKSPKWEGELKYLDYRSGKMVSIPAALKVNTLKSKKNSIEYLYPDEPHMNFKQKLKLDLANNKIEGRTISSVENSDGIVKIVATEKGKDDGKKVQLRYTYQIGENLFMIMKEFSEENSEKYTIRNIYSFTR